MSKIEGIGKVIMKFISGKELTLKEVVHIPDIRKNLISGVILNKKGFKMVFESDKFVLTERGIYVGKSYLLDGLFKANIILVDKKSTYLYPQVINKNNTFVYLLESSNLWHSRLGHVNSASIRKLVGLGLIPELKSGDKYKCESCVEAKFVKKHFNSVKRCSEPLGLIRNDICDLKFIQTRGSKKYFITFIDDHSRYCYIYLLSSKEEALNAFITYKNEIENQLRKTIKVLKSNRGGEYDSSMFDELCAKFGIIHQTTALYTLHQNGITKRKNKTLKDMVNTMLISSGLPQNLWGEAVLTANFILNRVSHKKTGSIPYEI